MEIVCKIKLNGIVLTPDQEAKVGDFVDKNQGFDVSIKYTVIKDVKSLQQLRFYFGVLLPAFVACTGETDKAKLDAYFRDKYLSSIHEVNGEQFKFIPSLQIGKNQVNKEKMTWYIEQVLNDLADIGGSIDMLLVEEYRCMIAANY